MAAKFLKDSLKHKIPVGNRGDIVAVTVSNYKGRDRVDIRRYYEHDDGTLGPTPSGVQIPPDQWSEFMKVLQAFSKTLKT